MVRRPLAPAFLLLASLLAGAVVCAGGGLAFEARAALLLRNTLLVAGGACLVAMLPGVPLAWLLLRTDTPGRSVGWVLVLCLLFVPVYLQATAWDAVFRSCGRLFFSAGAYGPAGVPGWLATIWIHGLAAVPWVVLITGTGLLCVGSDLEESALLDGSLAQVTCRVTLVLARPALAVAALWVFVLSSGEIAVTDLYQIRTFAEEVYTAIPLAGVQSSSSPIEGLPVPRGLAIIVILVGASLAVAAYVVPAAASLGDSRQRRFRIGAWGYGGLAYWAGVLLLLAGVPLAMLVFQAGVVVEPRGDEWLRSWSWQKLLRTAGGSPVEFRGEIGWSLLIGGSAATAAVVGAAPLAWLARRWSPVAWAALGAAAVLMALPGPTVGLRVIGLLNRENSEVLQWLYDRTILAPALAQLLRALPIAGLVCWYSVQGVAEETLEAALIDGAGFCTRFWRVVLPQCLRGFAAAWLLAFAVSTAELSATILTAPPGVTTVPLRIFGLLHAGVDDRVAGLCLTVVVGVAILASLTLWLLRAPQGEIRVSRSTRV